MNVVGIDIGVSGAIALVSREGGLIEVETCPS